VHWGEKMQQREERFGYLDSIRGIAAIIVLFSHCWLMLPHAVRDVYISVRNAHLSIWHFLVYVLYKTLMQGRQSVMVFFVLSGFVLTYSLEAKKSTYKQYIVRRFFRIYPVFLCAVLLSFCMHLLLEEASIVKSGAQIFLLLRHLLMWGTSDSLSLDGAIWSLVYEMRISLVFPLLLYVCKKSQQWTLACALACSLAAAIFVHAYTGNVPRGYKEQTFLFTLVTSFYFIVFFVIGIILCLKREYFICRAVKWPGILKCALLFSAAVMLCKANDMDTSWKSVIADYLYGVGAGVIILTGLCFSRMRVALEHKFPLWLGKISYPLYLIHMPVIFALDQTLPKAAPVELRILLAIGVSLATAQLATQWIEQPGIRLGRALVKTR
jgi:peptidoglycan/LPS O-acetylase OafA/YrhL